LERLGPETSGIVEQFATLGKLLVAVAVAQQAVVSEAHELGRQDVEEEAADELGSIEGHQAEAVAMGVVLPAESDLAFLEPDEAVVGDGDPVRVATEVIQDLGGAAERRLGVDDPVGLVGALEQVVERSRIRQGRQFSMKLELSLVERLLEIVKELAAEHLREDTYGQEKARTAWDPAAAVG